MPRNPNAQRPRIPGWPRVDRITVGVSLLERYFIRQYASREGLAVGAAARELIFAAMIYDAEAHPSASNWNATLSRVREQQALGLAEIDRISAALGIVD